MTTGEPGSSAHITKELIVTAAEAGERLDRVIAARDLDWSRSAVQRWIAEGRVLVDGRPGVASARVLEGATIVVAPAPPPPSTAMPEDIPLSVLFEDADVLVLDKPAGLVVHPAPGHGSGTLVNALLHRGAVHADGDPLRPGIVHRLDKDTSGVMVVARSSRARERLIELFKAHDIERSYVAIALGATPEQASYSEPIARHPVHRKRFSSKTGKGKRALTRVRTLERLHASALVECQLETGRTHQIRVHLADHGHPILGDALYGRAPRDPRLREAAAAIGRQALHAGVLGFAHPITGERVRFSSPPPADFEAALAVLRDEA